MEEIYDKVQEILEDKGIVFDSDFEGAVKALVSKTPADKTEEEMKLRLGDSIRVLYDNTKDLDGYHYYVIYGDRLEELYDEDSYNMGKHLGAIKYNL